MDEPIPAPQTEIPNKTNWSAFGLIVVFVLAAAALAAFLYFRAEPETSEDTTTTATSSATIAGEAAVSITKEGFSPATIKVKKGTSVTWTNNDTANHQVSSDPHPTHDQLPELGDGDLTASGESFSFVFDKTGEFTYHDNLNPLTFQGKVIVE